MFSSTFRLGVKSSIALDSTDLRILESLQSDASVSNQAVAQPLGRKDGDRFLDDPGLGEPLHPSKAGGGGDVHLGGQRLIG